MCLFLDVLLHMIEEQIDKMIAGIGQAGGHMYPAGLLFADYWKEPYLGVVGADVLSKKSDALPHLHHAQKSQS